MRTYEAWLHDTEAEILEAIREAESENWHHIIAEDPRAKLYNRLSTWLAAVVERRQWLDNTKRD